MPSVHTVYELEPIGVGGTLEATRVFRFCTESCAQTFVNAHPSLTLTRPDVEPDRGDGDQCDQCDRPIVVSWRD